MGDTGSSSALGLTSITISGSLSTVLSSAWSLVSSSSGVSSNAMTGYVATEFSSGDTLISSSKIDAGCSTASLEKASSSNFT